MDISVQTGGIVSRWGPRDGCRLIREAGFDGIDWGIDEAWDRSQVQKGNLGHCVFQDSLEEIQAYYREELAEIRKNGLKIFQAHAPFPPYVKGFPKVNSYAIEIYKQCIRFCDSLAIDRLVIHGISLAFDDKTQTKQSVEEMNRHLYESLIPVLRESNVTVCMENLFTRCKRQTVEGACADPHEACAFIDEMNEKAGKECFGICVDTGHLNVLGKNQRDYLCTMGTRVKAVHLHDNWGDDDSHLAPYTGNIVWDHVLEGLKVIGYRGNLNFETHQQVAAGHMAPETAAIWLHTICRIGEVFAEKLEKNQ
ncbi:MAG: sugar phosphate isomerase/epimerase [Hungatella sp.]|jgi:sugar phosphate isomerase/epimerase|nr:sugar phosphate isomerase/epimerase [Hungatella sp.]